MIRTLPSIVALALALVPGAAFAHAGVGDPTGLGHGLMHPLGGLDHVLAMVAVGLLAADLGGRATWMVPMSFMSFMAIGGLMGVFGAELPYAEAAIAMSVLVLGGLIALRPRLPTAAATGVAGLFALFHGHAHAAEMPMDVSGVAYCVGFLVATAGLHLIGIALGLATARLDGLSSARLSRLSGGAMAVAGAAMLAQTL